MHLNVRPEGRQGIWLVEKEDLKEWIKSKSFEQIHNFVQGGPAIIGADHDVESVLEYIEMAERQAVLTGDAQRGNMRHALALIINNRLEIYDIGEITESDLSVI